jgi:serine-type D-Ala-D-Ala endopeptidase (penicillin-binding protein 7)
MQQYRPSVVSNTIKRLFHSVALAALVLALAPAVADAAPRKSASVKKSHVHKRVVRSFAGKSRSVVRVAAVPTRPSFGKIAGLHSVQDQLDLKSSVALVSDL